MGWLSLSYRAVLMPIRQLIYMEHLNAFKWENVCIDSTIEAAIIYNLSILLLVLIQ